MPFDGDLLLLSNPQHEFDNQSLNLNMSPDEYIFSPLSFNTTTPPNNNSSSMECFFPNETLLISNELPSEITIDDIKLFQKTHDDYSMKFYQACHKFQYDFIEKLMQQFWSLTNIHYSQTNDLINNGNDVEKKERKKRETLSEMFSFILDPMIIWKFNRICTLPFILEQFRLFYSKFYQTIIDSYFPDILISLTSTIIVCFLSLSSLFSFNHINT